MINITKLYCDRATEGDALRYGRRGAAADPLGRPIAATAGARRPVVVWNITRTCNLRCIHCYTDSEARRYAGELTPEQGHALIEDLAQFGIPALLFSGGEPLTHPHLFEWVSHAVSRGVRPTLSTNGTLITGETARRIKESGFTYVGISLDGIGEINDCFRGAAGAFDRAVAGFRNCVAAGQRVGLRLTLTRHNYENLEPIFDFIEAEAIDRACFYHLVYSGRGSLISEDDLTPAMSRGAMDIILRRTRDFHARGIDKDILTVDNHADGPYLYLKLLEEGAEEHAARVRSLLEWNGGGRFSSGVGIGDIDFLGDVHPDQFWMDYRLGNVKERPFSAIWTDTSDPLLAGLKDRLPLLKGRCRECQFLPLCGGAMRVRAQRVFGDPWAPDPGCYLTDEEIGLTPARRERLAAAGEDYPVPAARPEAAPAPGPSPAGERA